MPFNQLPHLYITWDESTVGLDSFLRYQIYRRVHGDSTWTKLARINDRGRTSYRDYTAKAGVTHEIAVTQVEDVLGDEIESAKQDPPPQVSLTIDNMFIHDISSPGRYVEIKPVAADLSRQQDTRFLTPYSRRQPTSFIGREVEERLSLSKMERWNKNKEIWDALVSLQDAQRLNSAKLLVRQGREIHMFGQLEGSLGRSDQPVFSESSLEFRRVYHEEGVD